MALGSSPRSSASQSTTPGSRAPQRVPMQRPSSTLDPIVVATLAGAQGAEARAVAEVHHHGPPLPPRDRPWRAPTRRTRRRARGSRSGGARPRAAPRAARSARPRAACHGGTRCRSRPPAGAPGPARAGREIGARLCGWCKGASGTNAWSRASTASSTRTGAPNEAPPCTTRWPTPARRPVAERAAHQGQEVRERAHGRGTRSPASGAPPTIARPAVARRGVARPRPQALEHAAHVDDELAPARGRARTSSTTSQR